MSEVTYHYGHFFLSQTIRQQRHVTSDVIVARRANGVSDVIIAKVVTVVELLRFFKKDNI